MWTHLHIVACSPRSGTTLLHEAMVTCFRFDRHYDHERRFNLVRGARGETVISKRPKDTLYMPDVIDDPKVYVVYVLRDPRDVIVSRHGKDSDMYYSNIRLWRELHARARLMYGHPRFHQVRYEDFVADPDAAQRALVGQFPWLEQLHPFSRYHEHARVSARSALAMHEVRPIAPTSVGVWGKHLGRIKGQMQIHGSLTPDLVECNYEASADWERALDDVAPDFSRSRYPEKVPAVLRWARQLDATRKVASYRRARR